MHTTFSVTYSIIRPCHRRASRFHSCQSFRRLASRWHGEHMLMRGLWLEGALIALSVACTNLESPAPPQEGRLVVHSVINTQGGTQGGAGLDQKLLISRARTGISSVSGDGASDDEPVSGALVRMTVPNGSVLPGYIISDSQGSCCVAGLYLFDLGPDVS